MTEQLELTYAGFNYLDRTLALQLGEVRPAGIDLRFVTIPEIGALFRRQAQFAEFDASEMSFSTLMLMVGRGDRRFVGIPVFPSRTFRHGFIFVRTDSGIETPADLKGKRVGVQDYQPTAYVWLRAFLQHDYGVSPGDFTWFSGGLDNMPPERLHHEPPEGVDFRPAPRPIEHMLLDGELDAVMGPERLHAFRSHPEKIRRLFPDQRAVETDYWQRTHFFPIMHTVVIRRDVYDANPWVACSMTDAFEQSRRQGQERLRKATSPALALPWLADDIDELDRLFDGEALPIGFESNRPILEAITTYSFEQGFSDTKLSPEDLFAVETLTHVPN